MGNHLYINNNIPVISAPKPFVLICHDLLEAAMLAITYHYQSSESRASLSLESALAGHPVNLLQACRCSFP